MPLSDLIAALAAATGPSRELDERMAVEVFGRRLPAPMPGPGWVTLVDADAVPAYTASLDAITGACEQRWSNCSWACTVGGLAHVTASGGPTNSAHAATPALALCLAAARLAPAEGGR